MFGCMFLFWSCVILWSEIVITMLFVININKNEDPKRIQCQPFFRATANLVKTVNRHHHGSTRWCWCYFVNRDSINIDYDALFFLLVGSSSSSICVSLVGVALADVTDDVVPISPRSETNATIETTSAAIEIRMATIEITNPAIANPEGPLGGVGGEGGEERKGNTIVMWSSVSFVCVCVCVCVIILPTPTVNVTCFVSFYVRCYVSLYVS